MKLGERIYHYRTERGLSQSELAERLDVSRQSVSKWETDASVPELDKLINLCEVFGITMDALVRGEEMPPKGELPDEEPISVPPATNTEREAVPEREEHRRPPYHTTGVILLCTAAVVAILFGLMAGVGGLIFALPFFACGLLCVFMHRYVGLACAWTVYGLVSVYLSVATSITPLPNVLYMIVVGFRDGISRMFVLSLPMAVADLALVLWTVWTFRRRVLPITRKTVIATAVLLLGIVLARIVPSVVLREIMLRNETEILYGEVARMFSILGVFFGILRKAAVLWLLVRYIPLIFGNLRKKNKR